MSTESPIIDIEETAGSPIKSCMTRLPLNRASHASHTSEIVHTLSLGVRGRLSQIADLRPGSELSLLSPTTYADGSWCNHGEGSRQLRAVLADGR